MQFDGMKGRHNARLHKSQLPFTQPKNKRHCNLPVDHVLSSVLVDQPTQITPSVQAKKHRGVSLQGGSRNLFI